MWLIFCANTSLDEVRLRVAKLSGEILLPIQSEIRYIEAMQLSPINQNLKYLSSVIDNYDYVVCVSPSCIEFAKSIITNAITPKYLVMGEASFNKLSRYTKNQILYPSRRYGVDGLIDEILIHPKLKLAKFLVLKGNGESRASKLSDSGIDVDFLDIYNVLKLGVKEIDWEHIFSDNRVNLIGITSSSLVKWLFEECEIANRVAYLDKIIFAVWRVEIANRLREYGITNIRVWDTADFGVEPRV